MSEFNIAKEKAKARELRKTNWWNNLKGRGLCFYCGTYVPPAEITMDHIIPLSIGGESSKNNIVPACKNCNNLKKNKSPLEWKEYLEEKNSNK